MNSSHPGVGTWNVITQLTKFDHEAVTREVSILAECEHPHILRYIEIYDEEKFYYVITEVVSGGELFDRIAEKDKYDEHHARVLVRGGLLDSAPGADRREATLRLTPQGRETLAAAFPLWTQAQAEIEAALGRDAAKALRRVLSEI